MTHGLDSSFLVAAEIVEHADHLAARALLAKLVIAGDRFALAPQVLSEFLHVVTDPRRFARPLDMATAQTIAQAWWTAREIDPVFPTDKATQLFLRWINEHRLGRKRLLDTQLAAVYQTAGNTSLLTTNSRDFEVFGFICLSR